MDDSLVPASFLTTMLELKISNTPTLYVLKILTTVGVDGPNATYANALVNTAAVHNAGIPILAGTDSVDQAAPAFGEALHEELENLVAAGFSSVEALRAATSNIASTYGLGLSKWRSVQICCSSAAIRLLISPTRGIFSGFGMPV